MRRAKRLASPIRVTVKIWLTMKMLGKAVNTQEKPSHRTRRKTERGVRGRKVMTGSEFL